MHLRAASPSICYCFAWIQGKDGFIRELEEDLRRVASSFFGASIRGRL